MTDHVFTGHYASTYQEGRDATDRHIGTVEPFEIRDMDPDRLPDHQWREATDEDRERWAAILAEREKPAEAEPASQDARVSAMEGLAKSAEDAAARIGSALGDLGDQGTTPAGDETPPGPQPAAPAVIPQ